MIKASEYFLGRHDFKAFCSNKIYKKSTEREIFDITISKNDMDLFYLTLNIKKRDLNGLVF
ncbi:MAG: hypothetical protein IJE46_03005 [Clostridia bacterium]|nr:hypothetical protein [Clostridia bacterium]